MATRQRIVIDNDLCIGCGYCVTICHTGALELIDDKAVLVHENHCDGLGNCIGECPHGAISFEDVEDDTTPQKAAPSLNVLPENAASAPSGDSKPMPCGCPGTMSQTFEKKPSQTTANAGPASSCESSELNAWPIQLHLIRPTAEQFQGADVLIAASCSAFSHGSFHNDFLKGKSLIIACPKLDRQDGYLEKLTELFAQSRPASVSVLRMEVPCCSGLSRLVLEARQASGSLVPVNETIISLQGEVKEQAIV